MTFTTEKSIIFIEKTNNPKGAHKKGKKMEKVLKENECRIIGIKRGNDKNGVLSSNIMYVMPWSEYDKTSSESIEGFAVGNQYTKLSTFNLKVGDVVEFIYSKGFGDKAILSRINLIESGK